MRSRIIAAAAVAVVVVAAPVAVVAVAVVVVVGKLLDVRDIRAIFLSYLSFVDHREEKLAAIVETLFGEKWSDVARDAPQKSVYDEMHERSFKEETQQQQQQQPKQQQQQQQQQQQTPRIPAMQSSGREREKERAREKSLSPCWNNGALKTRQQCWNLPLPVQQSSSSLSRSL